MATLGQRWQTVVPLADSWRWVHNVGPTLGQHQHVLHEIWKSTSFMPTLGQHKKLRSQNCLYLVG